MGQRHFWWKYHFVILFQRYNDILFILSKYISLHNQNPNTHTFVQKDVFEIDWQTVL